MARGDSQADGAGPSQSQYDISGEERNRLVAEVMRYMLFKNHQHPGVPVRREELTQIVTKTYKQRSLPAEVINEAQKKFGSIFGYEMKELQRTRPTKNNQPRLSQQSTSDTKYYILKSKLPEELRIKFVEDRNTSEQLGLTTVVLATIHLAGGKIQEDTLWQHLNRLGLHEDDGNHPNFGNVKQALETITKQKFIQKTKMDGPEGDMTVYELAERALDEAVNGRLKEYVTQMADPTRPEFDILDSEGIEYHRWVSDVETAFVAKDYTATITNTIGQEPSKRVKANALMFLRSRNTVNGKEGQCRF